MVDIDDVVRGLACDCECPSCELPVIACKDEQRAWHFTHAPPINKTAATTVCDYSTFVSIWLMIHEVLPQLSRVTLPPGPGETDLQRRKVDIEAVEIETRFAGNTVDAVCTIDGVPLALYVTFPSRAVPEQLFTPNKLDFGVLQLSLTGLVRFLDTAHQYPNGRNEDKQWLSQDTLSDWLSKSVESKSWVYHPRQRLVNRS